MSREDVTFYTGLLIVLVGLIVWVLRPNTAVGKSEIAFAEIRFSFDVPAFAVMIIGIALMIISQKFHTGPEIETPVTREIVCTGEKEENCPGVHDIFYICGYFGTDDEIAKDLCGSLKRKHVRLKTIDGNRCGYSLIEVICSR